MRRIPWTDAVLAAGLGILACAEAIGYSDGSGRHLAGSLIVVAGAVSLAWRRTAPGPVAVLCSLGLVVPVLLAAPTTETISGAFALMVAVYSVAAYGPGLPLALIPAAVVVAASVIRSLSDWGDSVSVAIGVAMTGAAFVLGLVMRRQRRDTALSVERAAQAER